jgi:hypothetical protein
MRIQQRRLNAVGAQSWSPPPPSAADRIENACMSTAALME